MLNKVGFWLGGLVVVLLTAVAVLGGGLLASMAEQWGLGTRLLGVRYDEPVLLVALTTGLGAVAWVLAGWVLPLLGVAIVADRALDADVEPGSVELDDLFDKVGGPLGAISGRDLLARRFARWFFRLLPMLALGVGVLLALVALACGSAAELSMVGQPLALVQRSGLEGTVLALASLVIAGAGALVAALLFAGAGGAVEARLDRVVAALAPGGPAPSPVAVAAADGDILRQTLDGFIEQLGETSGARFNAIAETLRTLDGVAQGVLESVRETQASLPQISQAQLKTLGDSYTSSLTAIQKHHAKQVARAIDEVRGVAQELRTMIQGATQGIEANVASSQATTEQLLAALTREANGAQTMGQAAEQMAAAARVSRETVERFIALAERMRDLNRAISQGPAIAPAALGPIEPPLTDPETTRRLSSAIRDLQKVADESLPDL